MSREASELNQWRSMQPLVLDGICINGGMGRGFAHFHNSTSLTLQTTVKNIFSETASDVSLSETNRLELGLTRLRSEIEQLISAAYISIYDSNNKAGDEKNIFDSLRLLVHDRGWERRLIQCIENGDRCEDAILNVLNAMRLQFSKEKFWQSRLCEFEDLSKRLLTCLQTLAWTPAVPVHVKSDSPLIVVATSLSPADLIDYHRHNLVGLILAGSSYTSHVEIIAKSLRVPVVAGSQSVLYMITPGDPVIVDGDRGQIYVRPLKEVSIRAAAIMNASGIQLKEKELGGPPPVTVDGVQIRLSINANLADDLIHVHQPSIDGVGLFRTEIPFMITNELPSVQGQTEFYCHILNQMGTKPLCFRTLDIGGDKMLLLQKQGKASTQATASGWRAIRLSLDRPMLLRHQIRAFLRAKVACNYPDVPLSIMIPMVAEVSEFLSIRKIIQMEINREQTLGRAVPAVIQIGAMIEIPSIVYQLEQLLPFVDFLAVGSNDLQQFFFAYDRDKPEMSNRYDFLSPSFLAFLRQIIERVGGRVPLSICGESASQPLNVLALLGIGMTHLSVSPAQIGSIYRMITRVHHGNLKTYIDSACQHLLSPEGCVDRASITLRHRLKGFAVDRGLFGV
ncbi:MAG: putative PEP-binding protein [Pseudomonadota bacterium]